MTREHVTVVLGGDIPEEWVAPIRGHFAVVQAAGEALVEPVRQSKAHTAILIPGWHADHLRPNLHLCRQWTIGCAVVCLTQDGTGAHTIAPLVRERLVDAVVHLPAQAAVLADTIHHACEIAALRRDRERYAFALHATGELVYDWSIASNTTWWSEGARRLLGRDPIDLGIDPLAWYAQMHPDDRDRVVESVQSAILGHAPMWTNEYRYLHATGEYRAILDRACLFYDSAGEPVRMVGAMSDVTEARRIERELRASEARYRSLALATSQLVWTTDAEGLVTPPQPRWQEFTGQTDAEIAGMGWANAIHPEFLRHVLDRWTTAAQTRATFEIECPLRDKGSEYHHFAIRGAAITNEQVAVSEWVFAGDDITERLELEAQLLQSQKMEAVGRLAGGVAHDFNNLLSVIIGTAQFAADSLDPNSPVRDDLQQIVDAGQRAAALTQQLLAFARKQVIRPRVTDLPRMVERFENMMQRLIGEHIALTINVMEDIGRVMIDPGKFEQVLVNLIINARDAMPRGGRLLVDVHNEHIDRAHARLLDSIEPGPYVVLSVSDTGCGMSKDVLERVFEPFFTTKPAHLGTGLGLSTCYGIVKQAGGGITVDSDVNRGTTFRIYLPRVDSEPTPAPQGQAPFAGSGNETILLVEDEPLVRSLAERTLRQAGYEVLTAEHGEDAIDVSRAHGAAIHLLVTDVIMPKLGGKETAEILRRDRESMRVLYMSGYTGEALVERGILEEGIDFLPKPFTRAQLLTSVRRILDSSAFDN